MLLAAKPRQVLAVDDLIEQSPVEPPPATTWGILRALELEPVVPGAGALLAPTPEPVA